MRDSWPVVDGLYSLSSLPPVFPSIITRMEQCTWKLLTDEVIPFSVQSRMLGKATLHHVGAHVAARQHVAGYPAARRADGHPRESSCALRRWFQLGNRSIEKFFSKWILIFIYYLLCVYICFVYLYTDCMFFKTSAATVRAWLKALVATNDLLICTPSFCGASPNGLISFMCSPTHSMYLLSKLY